MLHTETLYGAQFIRRVRELEAKGHHFKSLEVGENNAQWILTYFSLPAAGDSGQPDLFAG